MSFSTGNMTAPCDEEQLEVTPEQCRAAQLTTAHFAEDKDELVQMLLMLGLYPGQEKPGFKVPPARFT